MMWIFNDQYFGLFGWHFCLLKEYIYLNFTLKNNSKGAGGQYIRFFSGRREGDGHISLISHAF